MDLDLGQIETLDHHVWDGDANDWLDDLIAELDEQSQLETIETNLDFENFENVVEDMTQHDWENVWNDVLDNFDSSLLP